MKHSLLLLFFMVVWDQAQPTHSDGLDGSVICGVESERFTKEFLDIESAQRFRFHLKITRVTGDIKIYEMVEQ